MKMDDKSRQIRMMFGRIAPTYDRMNHLLTLGIDILWRKKAVRKLGETPGVLALDICAGTGDLAREWMRRNDGEIILLDYSDPMLRPAVGKLGDRAHFVLADAADLPFTDNSIDIVMCAFGIRNLTDVGKGIRSIYRVLRPSGRLCILEFTKEDRGFLHKGFHGLIMRVVSRAAVCFSPDPNAYNYLADSIKEFCSARELATLLQDTGFALVEFTPLTLGLCVLFTAVKPGEGIP